MKDLITFVFLVIIFAGIFFAAPAFGITLGIGFGLWFLWEGWKEHRNA